MELHLLTVKGVLLLDFRQKQMKLLLYCLSCVLKIVTMNAELSLSPLIQKKNELKLLVLYKKL
jgi:hypothetical protein